PPAVAPPSLDDDPLLFGAAALARGRTIRRGIAELRVKESDRISAMAMGLRAAGVRVEELPDGLIIDGSGGEPVAGGAFVTTHLDHRIAMSFAVLSLIARAPIEVDDRAPINTSFPDFLPLMARLGALEQPA
ncbi:MAG: 3-phosphoshikimate 1-carboxyvinyltransferase, partial [Sandaracinobacter sp.]